MTTALKLDQQFQLGTIIYWHVRADFISSRIRLERLLVQMGKLHNQPPKKYKGKIITKKRNYIDLLSKNDYKTCFGRTLKSILPSDSFYRPKTVSPEISEFYVHGQRELDADLEVKKELVAILDKGTGELTFRDSLSSVLEEKIRKEFQAMQQSTDGDQIARLLTKVVQEECNGLSLKLGVYYIPDEFKHRIKNLEKIISIFDPKDVSLYQIAMKDDTSTVSSIQNAVVEGLFSEIETYERDLLEEYKIGKFNKKNKERIITNRTLEIETLRNRITSFSKEIGEENLHKLIEQVDLILKTLDA